MIQKKFTKTQCKATFSVSRGIALAGAAVYLVGDFNNWQPEATPMNRKKDQFVITLDLDLNREYQYRYLVNGQEWHNDEAADKYTPNSFGGENSVVTTYAEPVMA